MAINIHKNLRITNIAAKEIAQETVDIVNRGYYQAPSGAQVGIGDFVRNAMKNTVSYEPGNDPRLADVKKSETQIEVRNVTTLDAARQLVAQDSNPAALNFASATHPGGGFLNGAVAQEEYLCRSSATYACIENNAMYKNCRGAKDPFYDDYVIYSPSVPVFRDDNGRLMEQPYLCSMLTSPAVNASWAAKVAPGRIADIPAAMIRRIRKVLSVAQHHGHRSLVLGAWGCGAFGNDPAAIAPIFRNELESNFRGVFKHVIFAVADWSNTARIITPFRDAFGGGDCVLPA